MKKAEYIFLLLFLFISFNLKAKIYCESGTLIFKEDFGGNDLTDSDVKMYANSQVKDFVFSTQPIGPGKYSLRKKTETLASRWFEMIDHTYPDTDKKGYFLQIDGSEGIKEVYSFEINNLCAHKKLYFSLWAASIVTNSLPDKVSFKLVILDEKNHILHEHTTEELIDGVGIWSQYGTEYLPTKDYSKLYFKVYSIGTGPVGNSFVVDDIEVRLCTPKLDIALLPNHVICEGEAMQLISYLRNDTSLYPEPLQYIWQKNKSEKAYHWEWEDVAEGTYFSIPSLSLNDEAYYRLLVGTEENINSPNCKMMSEPIYLKVTPCNSQLARSRLYVSKDTTICKGDLVSLRADGADSYTWYPKASLNNHQIENPIAKPLENTEYYVTGTFSNGKVETKSIKISVCEPKETYIEKYICEGSIERFGSCIYNKTGLYTDTLKAKNGCDSIIYLDLKVQSPIAHTIDKHICRRTNYVFGEDTLKRSGVYTHQWTTKNGCDSIVTLNLTVDSPIYVEKKVSICSGQEYIFGNRVLTETGIYFETFKSVNRCDSNVTLHLDVIKKTFTPQEINIYEGRSFEFNGNVYTKEGVYVDNIKSSIGCDSLIVTNLKVLPTSSCPNIIVTEFFTPNGDGINDYWEIEHIDCYLFHEVELYNNKGQLILKWEDNFEPWDGTKAGVPLPDGKYLYSIKLGNRRAAKKNGSLDLMRD